ncbi:SAM-dependent methyltransferase [Vibrio japonicus]|uniref:SAM-dependent methyltransferase n=1 Tax=Vibrio japonicus TaxID=1824638 RepID=A0ABY5LH72_9VIBR|nr:SAM-dependent methyltransferase [Vibrio japonicus]UUM31393.1 SAM-dependent methyltransferase [Vibrio japonicus]
MQQRFKTLDTLLQSHQALWRFEPFFQSLNAQLPWAEQHPELCEWLNSLTPEQIEFYKADTFTLVDKVSRYLPDIQSLPSLTTLERTPLSGIELERGIDAGIPGRKLTQIVSMGEAALAHHKGVEWLEWCAGKGFLGRILASQSQQKVTSFEYQPSLCESGQADANRQGLPMMFVEGDALVDEAERVFNSRQHAVALHACGDLHVSLIKKGVKHKLPAMTISPCCYHLTQSQNYEALSLLGKASTLALTKSELRIPLQETVTGGERVKRHRFEEMSFRLGLDLLLREECGFEHYEPVPSIKKSMLSEGFNAFCRWAEEQKQLTLPDVDFNHYLALGEKRYWHMERMSLVQQVFRRGLEFWLVLDKAMYLEQEGYKVSIEEFCAKSITPRNILIQAMKL